MTDHSYPHLEVSRILGLPYAEALAMDRAIVDGIIARHEEAMHFIEGLLVDQVARNMAIANNGGDWAEHYTGEQIEVWRLRAKSIIGLVRACDAGVTPPTAGSRPPSPD